jgi:hypothetical protein
MFCTTIAGGRNGHSLMSDFLLNKDSIIIDLSADSSIDVSGHALVFNRGALGVDNDDFMPIASACNGCVG